MILTVTLNAALDKTYRVERFSIDKVHRPSAQWTSAGGKGINVARVYRALGGEATATGFLGGNNGAVLDRSLETDGVDRAFVEVESESRLCIAVVDPATGTQTEVNENGPEISSGELGKLRSRFEQLVSIGSWHCAALCGSLPPGVPVEIYSDLIQIARRAGVKCALDASGESLIAGMAARPWLAKPNTFELRTVVGYEPKDLHEVAEAADSLRGDGTEIVAATLGSQGAICAAEAGRWRAVPPKIAFISAVGSGDSFLAAFLHMLENGSSCAQALEWGVAAGAANASAWGAGFISRQQIESCVSGVRMEPL